MDNQSLKGTFNLLDIYRNNKYLKEFRKEHPYYFDSIGTCIFCGSQGSGKTLSAVKYVCNLIEENPYCILVSNVAIKDHPFNAKYKVDKDFNVQITSLDGSPIILPSKNLVIEYDGLDCLKYISNGYLGVIFLIDELHLELNSLESKNIDIDVITEISQQRKQRKHIVGTSQVYMRLAKPLREQIFDVIECHHIKSLHIQFNKLLDGEQSVEVNGKLETVVLKRFLWIASQLDYTRYDTFAKMKRYNKEWNGHKRDQKGF